MTNLIHFLTELTAIGMIFAGIFVLLTIMNLGWPLIPFAIWWIFFYLPRHQQ